MVITFLFLFGLFGGLTFLALGVAFLSDVSEAALAQRHAKAFPPVVVLPAFQADTRQEKYGQVRELGADYYPRAA